MLSMSSGVTVNYFQGIWKSGVTFVTGVPATYVLRRHAGRLSRVLEEIITLPLAIPGLAITLALILVYGTYGDFRKSWAILVGHVLYTMPFNLGITAVYVTHDQGEALVLGDCIIVMDKGGIAQTGTARDVYLRQQSRFVAEFIGTMNRIEGAICGGRFESAAGGLHVGRDDGERAAAFFRPESVTLLPPEEAPVRLAVERVHFLGAIQRVHLRGADVGRPIIVDTDNRRDYTPGMAVGITIAAEDLLFL